MKNRNLILGLGAIVVCAILMLAALNQNKVSSVKFAELASYKPDERCQVYGVLDAESIKAIKGANVVRFDLLEEEKGPDGKMVLTGKRLQVVYDNPSIGLPATFPAASHAKVSGTYMAADGRFIGDTVQTKCPSKYDEKKQLDLARKDAVSKWQKAIGAKEEAPKTGSAPAFRLPLVR